VLPTQCLLVNRSCTVAGLFSCCGTCQHGLGGGRGCIHCPCQVPRECCTVPRMCETALTIQVEPSRAEMVLIHNPLRVHHTHSIYLQLLQSLPPTPLPACMQQRRDLYSVMKVIVSRYRLRSLYVPVHWRPRDTSNQMLQQGRYPAVCAGKRPPGPSPAAQAPSAAATS
jgi:hypothetical protein